MDSVFSGSEDYGKSLDVDAQHHSYLNLKGANRWVRC